MWTPSGVDPGKILLEEYLYHSNPDDNVSAWADWLARYAFSSDGPDGIYTTHYSQTLYTKLVILPDNDFRDFTLYGTQVVTRVALDQSTKTVDAGPFTMELLPADALLYVPITAQRPRAISENLPEHSTAIDVLNWFNGYCFPGMVPPRMQIGGDETVGYGRVALRWSM